MYATGKGVDNNLEEADKWLQRARQQGVGIARNRHEAMSTRESAGENTSGGGEKTLILNKAAKQTPIANVTTRSGKAYKNVTVQRVEPDALTVEFEPDEGGLGVAKLRFEELSEDLRQRFGYDASRAAEFQAEQAQAVRTSGPQPRPGVHKRPTPPRTSG